jgi:hypothetical protein
MLSCTTKQTDFPQGAWKQYSSEIYTDSVLSAKDLVTHYNMKIFSEKNWEFVWKDTTDSIPKYYYGAGTYILDGNDYSEIIDLHAIKEYEGQTLKMILELKNDTLVQTWNPLDSTGAMDTKIKFVDKFIHLH